MGPTRKTGRSGTRPRQERVRDALLFAPMGQNPSHIVSLGWALLRQHKLRITAARLVLFASGARYLEDEVLVAGGALEALRAHVDRSILAPDRIARCVPVNQRGTLIEDDTSPADAVAFYDAVVSEAQAAIAEAGERPVVFALLGGSQRTLTTVTTVVAQLLARPRDSVFDIRYVPKWAGDPNHFFFPEQPNQRPILGGPDRPPVSPADVKVTAVPVLVPRLGAMVKAPPGVTYSKLLDMGQASIDAAAPPTLHVDLRGPKPSARLEWPGTARAAVPLKLTPAQFLHVGALALAKLRAASSGEPGWLRSLQPEDTPSTHPFLELARACDWSQHSVRDRVVKNLHGNAKRSVVPDDIRLSMAKLRSDTIRTLEAQCRTAGVDPTLVRPDQRTQGGKNKLSFQALPGPVRLILPKPTSRRR